MPGATIHGRWSFFPTATMAQQQWLALQAVPTGPNYLAAQTIAWAQARPADPQVLRLHR